MESSKSNDVLDEKRVTKRSTTERMFVWSGIVVLLAIVLVEQQSRSQFHSTLNRLEAAINTRDEWGHFTGILAAEAEQHVKGFVFRDEKTVMVKGFSKRGDELVEMQRHLTYRWPSLFKLYKLGVTVNSFDHAILVETHPVSFGS